MRQESLSQKIDWVTILLFGAMVMLGWMNIYAANYNPDLELGIFDFSTSAGRQFVWICTSGILIAAVFLFDYKFFDSFAYIIYGVILALLVFVLIGGKEVAGSKSWIGVGSFGLQPSEFAKFATALVLARYIGKADTKLENLKSLIVALLLIAVPMVLIALQGDIGTALVFAALIIPLFMEGMPIVILMSVSGLLLIFLLTLLLNQTLLLVIVSIAILLAIGLNTKESKRIMIIIVTGVVVVLMIRSVDFILSDVLKPYQQKRVLSLVNPNIDPLGIGWNVNQSKIAIGSGGLFGKGFLEGTQTKFDFVPEQSTDFIFCTIGEEHGWIGSSLLIFLFVTFLLRLIFLTERQKSSFARVFGYSVVSIIFFHFSINIAMTIGLFPVVGIPLPFFSYGGSSLWAFTILLFVFLKLDAHRMQELQRW
ncbi:MAG: rod shape-determining protein RodA [Ekhidna sp.]|nr:rod shape-determining protein RodA [Ekhidna sp.]MBC6409201.1 rod shape-determining protein RodA [Ekhidna sp.]MBC6426279.1 rod shape-determining protein RodA [Ekhidna sp.]